MKYTLSDCHNKSIEISESKYEELDRAAQILWSALQIESRYELVIINYLEFENEIVQDSIKDMVKRDRSYLAMLRSSLNIGAKLAGLLTVVKMYKDQIHYLVGEIEHAKVHESIKKIFAEEYDKNNNFQFMEAYRNHVQHYGLPVKRISKSSRWENDSLVYSTELLVNHSSLEKDKKFKKIVRENFDEVIDLKETTRSYVESISSVHDLIRQRIFEPVNYARTAIEDAYREYEENGGTSNYYLQAHVWDEDKKISSVVLTLDWDYARTELLRENPKLINLQKRYVTGKQNQ